MINLNKNYLKVVNEEISVDNFEEYYSALKFVDAFDWKYRDADSCSEDLYSDLCEVFYKGNEQIWKNNWTIIDRDFRLGADYIGPPTYWGYKAGLSGKEIYEFLNEARKLGGHMLWPRNGRGLNSINPARGGKKGYYDRIDLTLWALKEWYSGNKNIRICNAFNKSGDWLNSFDSSGEANDKFKRFIDFFLLNDFVDESYMLYDLTSFNDINNNFSKRISSKEEASPSIPNEYCSYINYVKGNLLCIENRNGRIRDFLGERSAMN